MAYGSVTASTTAAVIPAPLSQDVDLTNYGSVTVFIGDDSAVVAATGLPILPGQSRSWQGVRCYVVTASGTSDVRWLS